MAQPYKPKGRKVYYLDVVINGIQYRESLKTTDWRDARKLARERIRQLEERAPDTVRREKSYASMDIATAMKSYAEDRRAQVSPRMVAYWKEQARPLAAFFKVLKLRRITSAHIAEYQNSPTRCRQSSQND